MVQTFCGMYVRTRVSSCLRYTDLIEASDPVASFEILANASFVAGPRSDGCAGMSSINICTLLLLLPLTSGILSGGGGTDGGRGIAGGDAGGAPGGGGGKRKSSSSDGGGGTDGGGGNCELITRLPAQKLEAHGMLGGWMDVSLPSFLPA